MVHEHAVWYRIVWVLERSHQGEWNLAIALHCTHVSVCDFQAHLLVVARKLDHKYIDLRECVLELKVSSEFERDDVEVVDDYEVHAAVDRIQAVTVVVIVGIPPVVSWRAHPLDRREDGDVVGLPNRLLNEFARDLDTAQKHHQRAVCDFQWRLLALGNMLPVGDVILDQNANLVRVVVHHACDFFLAK